MDIASLGAGAAIALTILGVVFGFLIKMKWLTTNQDNPTPSKKMNIQLPDDITEKINTMEKSTKNIEKYCEENEEDIKTMFKQTDELQQLHSVKDENGIPIWYRSKALENIAATQTRALNDIALTLQKLEIIQINQSKIIESQTDIFKTIFQQLENSINRN